MSRYLSVRQAALRSGASETVVRGWVKSGALPHYRLGLRPGRGKIAVAESDLDAFLAGRRVEAARPQARDQPAAHRADDVEFQRYYKQVMDRVARRRR